MHFDRPTRLQRTLSLTDLTSLAISSVGPAFSISATAGVMVLYSGIYSLVSIALIAFPFIISAVVFRLLNQHFPNAGASYHWSARVMGTRASRFQAWVVLLAYFTSIPPIVLPAAQYTIDLIHPSWLHLSYIQLLFSVFWIVFAGIALYFGSRPTAQITKFFLIIELIFLAAFAAVGLRALPHAHLQISYGVVPIKGVLITMIIATTMLDGWEIDSYASEEAGRPKRDPGLAGIFGAILALVIYLVFIPLILIETPAHQLVNSTDPMMSWARQLQPYVPRAFDFTMLVPILASTAGSLWLTSFILVRALYAMGRDRLMPRRFASLNRHSAPAYATVVILIGVSIVTAIQLFAVSLAQFFSAILSMAGFFLTLEFMLDNLTAVVFLTKLHHTTRHGMRRHTHRFMKVASWFNTLFMLFIMLVFLWIAPQVIADWIDWAILACIVMGFVFMMWAGDQTPAYDMKS